MTTICLIGVAVATAVGVVGVVGVVAVGVELELLDELHPPKNAAETANAKAVFKWLLLNIVPDFILAPILMIHVSCVRFVRRIDYVV